MNKIFSIPTTTGDSNRLSVIGPDFEGDYLVEVYGEGVLLTTEQWEAMAVAMQQELVDRKAREDGAFAAACATAASRG